MYRVQNWAAYEESFRRRGDITFICSMRPPWDGWKPRPFRRPGGQRKYSDLAVQPMAPMPETGISAHSGTSTTMGPDWTWWASVSRTTIGWNGLIGSASEEKRVPPSVFVGNTRVRRLGGHDHVPWKSWRDGRLFACSGGLGSIGPRVGRGSNPPLGPPRSWGSVRIRGRVTCPSDPVRPS
jgi:hypothetical protein